jgi:hypothetical protein
MDLLVIITYLDRKRLSARAIDNDIVATLGSNIVGYKHSHVPHSKGEISSFN